MSITHEAYLNIVPGDSPAPIIKVSQYDADFSIVFHLIAKKRGIVPAYPRTVENDEDITINIPTSATVSVRGTKTDGNGYSANATLSGTATAPIVTVAGHEQMTASAGVNVYEITFYADNATKRLSTANFILFVEPAALDASTITSESLMLELNDLIASVPNAVAAADRAEAAAQSVSSSAAQIEQNRQDISGLKTKLDAITPVDNTLRISGKAADAKKVGDEIADIKADLSELEPGLSAEAKIALLACFEHVEWSDEEGQACYDALESALNVSKYPMIKAVFNPDGHRFFTYDQIDSLKYFLTVTYFETEESQGTVIANSNYTLSGTLTSGVSTIKALYDGLSTSFRVQVNEITRESGLPSEYEQVTYIQGTGTQYITTNLLSSLPMRAEMRIQRGIGQPVVGAGISSNGNSRFFLAAYIQDNIDKTNTRIATRISDDMPTQPSSTEQGAVNGAWFCNRMVSIRQGMAYDVATGVDLSADSKVNTYITVDGKTANIERKEPVVGYPMQFMKVPINSDITKLILYGIKFYTGDTLLFNGIPCYNKETGSAGIYDVVNNVFYENAGTGTFKIGDIVA